MGLFYDVLAEYETAPDGVVVVFRLSERPMVSDVQYVGHKFFSRSALAELTKLVRNAPQNTFLNERARQKIEDKYKENGFAFAQVFLDAGKTDKDDRVVFRIVEGPRVRVAEVRVAGNKTLATGTLKGLVKTSPPVLWFIGGYFNQVVLDDDLQVLRNHCREQGFFDVKVSRELTFSDDRRQVTVTFVIGEGPQYMVERVLFEGVSKIPEAELLDGLRVHAGSAYDKKLIEVDRRHVEDRFGGKGYVYADVQVQHRFTATPARVALVYRVKEGDTYRVDRVIVTGNRITQDKVVRRQVLLAPGDVFDRVKMRQSQRQLIETFLFRSDAQRTKPKLEPTGSRPGWRDLKVSVEEQETGHLLVGVGVSSNAGLLGTIGITQRNFDIGRPPRNGSELWRGEAWRGAGQSLSLQIQPGTELTQFQLSFREPYLFDQPLSLGTGLFLFQRDRGEWTEERIGARVGLGRQLRKHWFANVGTTMQSVGVKKTSVTKSPPDILEQKGNHTLLSFQGAVTYDRRDSRVLPTEGYVTEFGYEQFVGDDVFGKFTLEGRRYWRVFERPDGTGKQVFLLRARTGLLVGDSFVPERFYAGGFRSLRGFAFRGVGPRQRDEPVGGDFMIVGTAEYMIPLWGDDWTGFVFTDAGTVERKVEVTEIRASVGLGFRIRVPFFGPVPLEFAFGFPIAKADGDDEELFSFSVGLFY